MTDIDYSSLNREAPGPTELYSQLRTVAGDDLPARLCSEFVCKSCNRSIITTAKQKERFENSGKELVEKLHGIPASVLPCMTQRAEGTVKTPPRRPRPSHSDKRSDTVLPPYDTSDGLADISVIQALNNAIFVDTRFFSHSLSERIISTCHYYRRTG